MNKLTIAEIKAATRTGAERHSFNTAELPDEKVMAIAATKMDRHHDHLNKLIDSK
jgi:hypothetical protein